MVRNKGLILKWGFALLLLVSTCSLAVQGAQPNIETTVISNFDVFEADLRDVFRSLAEYGGLNVLMDKQVQGTVTTKFQSGLTVKQAIEILAQTNGFSFRWLMPQRTVLIGNEASFKNIDVMQTKIYSLRYADPETVLETLKVIVPKEQVGLDKRTNQLVVRANMLEQQNVEEVVTRLDRETPQISIEVRIEEVTRKALDEMGVLWDLEKAFSLDFQTPKITYKAGQTLKLWEEKTDAKLLSKPTVATTDSREAVIFIGDKIPIIKTSTDSSGNSTTTVEYIDVGTKLLVTPRINSDNIVTVNVKAQLSNVTDTKTIVSATQNGDTYSNEVPVVRNRETGSVIRLKDGETFMLSGLNQSETTTTDAGIKGLKKIPLLGHLFGTKSTEDPKNGTEIVIFVTPKILRTEPAKPSPAKAEVKEEKPVVGSNTTDSVTVVEQTAVVAAATAKPAETSRAAAPVTQTAKIQAVPVAASQEKPLVPAVAQATPVPTPPLAQPATVLQTAPPSPTPVKSATLQATATPAPTPLKAVVLATAAPTPTPAKSLAAANGNGAKKNVKVKTGDTLSNVALRFGLPKEVIMKDNALKATDSLTPGQELILSIPSDHLYTLQPKETVWRIAKRYGVTVDDLKSINDLTDVTVVEKGQTLILPVSVREIFDNRF